jgi:cyclic pyranopterin phosphate synthase
MIDPFGRSVSYLRVSVTDRCDLRCVYCMAEDMTFLPKAEVLTLEELDRLCGAFISLGVQKIRLTGGEPLVRRGVMSLVESLGQRLGTGALRELTLTTNGTQLTKYADGLAKAGVRRINVSLDTLDAARFRAATRWGEIGKVLDGIFAAKAAGLHVKINAGRPARRQRGRVRQHAGLVRPARLRPLPDRDHAARRDRRGPRRPVPAAVAGEAAAGPALDP